MRWITARRRRPIVGYAAVLMALVAVGMLYAAVSGLGSGNASASSPAPSQQQITQGKNLFAVSCATCHGEYAQGSAEAPSLVGAGAAAVDFQVSTGRMPLKETDAEAPRKPPVFTQQEIYAIAAYVASLGGGPAVPSGSQVSSAGADTAPRPVAVQRELRPVPQLRRGGRRPDRRQVRAAADPGDQPADLRGHADRARGHAGVQRQHDHAG